MDVLSKHLPPLSTLPGLALKGGMSVVTNPEKAIGMAMIAINVFGAARDLAKGKMPRHMASRMVGVLGGALLVRSATIAEHNKQLESNLAEQEKLNGKLATEVGKFSSENIALKKTHEGLNSEVTRLATQIEQMEKLSQLVQQVAAITGGSAKEVGTLLTVLGSRIDEHKALIARQEAQVEELKILTQRHETTAVRLEELAKRESAMFELTGLQAPTSAFIDPNAATGKA